MAHEINQPLGIISLALENIFYKIIKQQYDQKYLQNKFSTISENIDKIQQIIEHVRLFSRGQMNASFEKVEVDNTIRNALKLIIEQYKKNEIELVTELNCPGSYTVGNRHKLEQVIHNLLSNSRFSVEEKASLISSVNYHKNILIKTSLIAGKIQIEVRDNGTGISSENLEKIFNPFFTTKPEGVGTGLGLSVVYGIVKEMDGEITVNSKWNDHTTVKIILPSFLEKK